MDAHLLDQMTGDPVMKGFFLVGTWDVRLDGNRGIVLITRGQVPWGERIHRFIFCFVCNLKRLHSYLSLCPLSFGVL